MEPHFNTKEELKAYLNYHSKKKSVGFVPTMGALHQGHISLLERAFKENDLVVSSIFVNPTQFNNHEDLINYPSTLENDLKLIREISKEIVVFTPSVQEMYQENVQSKNYDFEGIDLHLEGLDRPGHFDGVGTIVEELLRIVSPNKAYFGEKDFQQLLIVKSLVKQLQLPIEIISCPIVRESNGLAMSSRNSRLTQTQRDRAVFIYDSLVLAMELAKNHSPHQLKEFIQNHFVKEVDFDLKYFEIACVDNFLPVTEFIKNQHYRFLIAVVFHDVRLIDNVGYTHLEIN